MARKALRLPKGDEWTKLPTSKTQAIKLGLNRFIPEDGQLREIRRFGSKLYSNGKVELWSSRSGNRGGGSYASRQHNEQLSTPPWADKTAYNKARANANGMGLDADHIRTIARTAGGIKWLESTGRGDRNRLWDSYERAGLPLGNQAGNIEPEDPATNQSIIPAEYDAMDNGIANANGGYDPSIVFKQIDAWKHGTNAMASFIANTGQRILKNGVPGAGTTLSAVNANGRQKEFADNPNLQNGVQYAAALTETAANGFGDFALSTGIGAPLAGVAEIVGTGAGLIDEGIDASEGYSGN